MEETDTSTPVTTSVEEEVMGDVVEDDGTRAVRSSYSCCERRDEDSSQSSERWSASDSLESPRWFRRISVAYLANAF